MSWMSGRRKKINYKGRERGRQHESRTLKRYKLKYKYNPHIKRENINTTT